MSNLICDFCNTRKEKLYKCGYKADRKRKGSCLCDGGSIK